MAGCWDPCGPVTSAFPSVATFFFFFFSTIRMAPAALTQIVESWLLAVHCPPGGL